MVGPDVQNLKKKSPNKQTKRNTAAAGYQEEDKTFPCTTAPLKGAQQTVSEGGGDGLREACGVIAGQSDDAGG